MPWERDYEEEAGQAVFPPVVPTKAAMYDVFGLPITSASPLKVVEPAGPYTQEDDNLKVSN